jgi:hypothetical protein
MRSSKLFQLAVLFLIGVALLASTPALALDVGPITLTNTGAEPGASGTATLTNFTFRGFLQGYPLAAAWDYWGGHYQKQLATYSGQLTATLKGLTPGATYRIGPTTYAWMSIGVKAYQGDAYYYHFTASDNGTAEVAVPVSCADLWLLWGQWRVRYWAYPCYVDRAAGNNTYTTVLYGNLPIVHHAPPPLR